MKNYFLYFTFQIALLLTSIVFPQQFLHATMNYPHGDGQVRVFNYHLGEFAEIKFREGNKVHKDALRQFNELLRSRDNSKSISIDPRLLDLIDYLQDHFGVDTIEIISGYRSKEFNEALLKGGHSVSPISLHTKGKALDIHIDEIREEILRDYLASLQLGGVGYYGPFDFVHIDTGPIRTWGESSSPRKLVGVLDPKSPVQLTSDKNDYLPGEILNFTWEIKLKINLSRVKDVQLEHFWRGQWIVCEASGETKKTFGLPSSFLCHQGDLQPTYGKYRWTFRLEGNDALLSSNEFYLKKQ